MSWWAQSNRALKQILCCFVGLGCWCPKRVQNRGYPWTHAHGWLMQWWIFSNWTV